MKRRTNSRSQRPPRTRAALIRVGALALLILVATALGYKFGWFNYAHALRHIERLRHSYSIAAFTAIFVAVYAVATSMGFPGMPFTVASGALFGTLLGSAIAWTGALIGAIVGYWLARTVGHDVVSRWLERSERATAAINQARDFTGLLRLRLIPVLPLGTINFVAGLAKSPFVGYLAATAIGVLPTTFVYTYFADSLVEGVGDSRSHAMASLVVSSACLIGLSVLPALINRRARREKRASAELPIASRSALGD